MKLFVLCLTSLFLSPAFAEDPIAPSDFVYQPPNTIERAESDKLKDLLNCHKDVAADYAKLRLDGLVKTDLTYEEACVVLHVLHYAEAHLSELADAQKAVWPPVGNDWLALSVSRFQNELTVGFIYLDQQISFATDQHVQEMKIEKVEARVSLNPNGTLSAPKFSARPVPMASPMAQP